MELTGKSSITHYLLLKWGNSKTPEILGYWEWEREGLEKVKAELEKVDLHSEFEIVVVEPLMPVA